MGRNIERIIAALPKRRRGRINSRARQMAGEMIAHAASLADVRNAGKDGTNVVLDMKRSVARTAKPSVRKKGVKVYHKRHSASAR
jgi:hypothetical protein